MVEFLLPYRCPSDYEDVLCGGGTGQNTCNGDSGARSLVLCLLLPQPLQLNSAVSTPVRLRCHRAAALPCAAALPWLPAPGEPRPIARCACPAVCGMLCVSCLSCVWPTSHGPAIPPAAPPAGGPLIFRNAEGKAVVVGVTSHGPDCQSQPNNPNYAYGFYTGMNHLLNQLPHACVRMPGGCDAQPPSEVLVE